MTFIKDNKIKSLKDLNDLVAFLKKDGFIDMANYLIVPEPPKTTEDIIEYFKKDGMIIRNLDDDFEFIKNPFNVEQSASLSRNL